MVCGKVEGCGAQSLMRYWEVQHRFSDRTMAFGHYHYDSYMRDCRVSGTSFPISDRPLGKGTSTISPLTSRTSTSLCQCFERSIDATQPWVSSEPRNCKSIIPGRQREHGDVVGKRA